MHLLGGGKGERRRWGVLRARAVHKNSLAGSRSFFFELVYREKH